MGITNQRPREPLEQLLEREYEWAVFISWPEKLERRFGQFVEDLAHALEDRFENEGGGRVCWERPAGEIAGTTDQISRRRLCRSAVMLAVLLPTYFHSDRCAVEWAIAHHILNRRIWASGDSRGCLLPLSLCEPTDSFPIEANGLTALDGFRKAAAYSRRLKSYPKWYKLIEALADDIRRVAVLLCEAEPCDWASQEEEAQRMPPFAFTWPEHDEPRPLPTLIVERSRP